MKVQKDPLRFPERPEAPLFGPIVLGSFIDRPNRFVIRCATAGGVVEAYMPNPGRMWELLLPGRTVYLVGKAGGQAGLAHMAVAVERDGIPLLLHTHASNAVAAALIARGRIPGLEDAEIVRREVQAGKSRFDFLLQKNGRPFYLEVKSCTLVGRRIAMFPDAITARGKRHLEELAGLSRSGTACGVLFLIHWPQARFFLPDYHTDLEFARTFLAVRNDLSITAVSLGWRADLSLDPEVRAATIPWELIEQEARDAGSYLMLLHLPRAVTIAVGSLGMKTFAAGHYLYVGTASRGLSRRMERHRRKGTAVHWHIDHLKGYADRCTPIPIRSASRLEHELAAAVGKIADGCVADFGSSDCDCPGHLFHFTEHPLRQPSFIDLLLRFRIDRLESLLPLK
ncbi:MAG: DNA/RNA nuclease SfsA [Deltaproteobacteria bacterium]|nr:DNA/RNA nuclease SfsA [Deltaproteobacteria bacterium]